MTDPTPAERNRDPDRGAHAVIAFVDLLPPVLTELEDEAAGRRSRVGSESIVIALYALEAGVEAPIIQLQAACRHPPIAESFVQRKIGFDPIAFELDLGAAGQSERRDDARASARRGRALDDAGIHARIGRNREADHRDALGI